MRHITKGKEPVSLTEHRATAFDDSRHRRDMRRTTVYEARA